MDLAKVDEVWLALDQAKTFLMREGHKVAESPLDCMGCYTLYLVERGQGAYRNRIKEVSK